MNLSCKKASQLLSEEQDRDLSFTEWSALQAHLVLCAGCRAVAGQLKFLRRALRALLDRPAA